MPTLRLKDPEVHRLARELAERRRTTITAAVREALAEAVEREPAPQRRASIEELMALARKVRESSDEPFLTDDDLYDEHGLPK